MIMELSIYQLYWRNGVFTDLGKLNLVKFTHGGFRYSPPPAASKNDVCYIK